MRIQSQNLIWMQCATAMVIFVAILPRGASDSGKNTDRVLCCYVYEDFWQFVTMIKNVLQHKNVRTHSVAKNLEFV